MTPDQVENAFPATVLTKVIMTAQNTFTENKEVLASIVEGYELKHSGWDYKMSGKGRYMSVNFFAEIPSRELLYELYGAFQKLEEVKYVL